MNATFSAPAATRELSEFIREVALAHDNYAKGKNHNLFQCIYRQNSVALCRLGKQEKSNSPHILISPIWKIVKVPSSIPPSTLLEFILVVCGEIWSSSYGIIEKII